MGGERNKLLYTCLRFKAELLADKKKATLLCLLVATVVVLGARLALDGGPSRAKAAVQDVEASGATDEPMLNAQVYQRTSNEYLHKLDTTVKRDLFEIDYNAYPPVDPEQMAEQEAARKANYSRGDDSAVIARRLLEAEVQRAASSLQLQSTVMGNRPTAIINGQVLTVGQSIEGLMVRHIGSGSCVLTRSGVAVTLGMRE